MDLSIKLKIFLNKKVEIDVSKIYKSMESLEGITGISFAFASFLLLWGRKLNKFVFSVRSLVRFNHIFGSDPAEAIKKALYDLERSGSIRNFKQELFAHELSLGIYICEPDGKCIDANDTLVELFGLSRDKFMGYGWTEAIVPEDRRETIDEWEFAVKKGSAYYQTYRVRNATTGETFPCFTKAMAVIDTASDKLLCYVGYVRRIKENESPGS